MSVDGEMNEFQDPQVASHKPLVSCLLSLSGVLETIITTYTEHERAIYAIDCCRLLDIMFYFVYPSGKIPYIYI